MITSKSYAKQYYLQNKSKIRQRANTHYGTHKPKRLKQIRKWQSQNVEKCQQYLSKSVKRHRQHYLRYWKKWHEIYYLMFPWVRHYQTAKTRCINPKHKAYQFYGKKGIKFLMTKEDFKYLWFRDKAYMMKHPHIHRVNSCDNYNIPNCAFIGALKHRVIHMGGVSQWLFENL